MVYVKTDFDIRRLCAYAKKVAEARATSSFSLVPTELEGSRRKGWFSKETFIEESYEVLPGWVVLRDAQEGQYYSQRYAGSRHSSFGRELGRVLLLNPEGSLLYSDYVLECRSGGWPTRNVRELKGLNFKEATVDDIIDLDRLNRYHYRTVRPDKGKDVQLVLGRNFIRKVPHPGMETSLALKRFLEQNMYVQSLTQELGW